MKEYLNCYQVNDMALLYILDTDTEILGFTMVPWERKEAYTLEGNWKTEPLIQLKCIGDASAAGFSGGQTMRNGETVWKMKYKSQVHTGEHGSYRIETITESESLRGIHTVCYQDGDAGITVWTELLNIGGKTERIEMLSSFSLCGLFGWSEEERTADFQMHRLRSRWSAEGMLETRDFTTMQMEPSWQRYGVRNVRYGQVGSMPVRGFFPWFAVEDKKNRCLIGGNLAVASSWQIELFSEDERPAVSGGIADREFGHWVKCLKPGERFVSPKAELTTCIGDLDDLANRITDRQREFRQNAPDSEQELPILFNEFCTTWGTPSAERVDALAAKLEGKGIRYFVIDAGWYADPVKGWESNMGDWVPSETQFPDGLKTAADAIRAHGMIPGIWFEPETAGKDAAVYQDETMLLTRDGYPVTTARRRFLDMRKDCVNAYLDQRMIRFLKEHGFGYLKVDYNDTIGLGCDGEESLGENLRRHMECSRQFYKKIRREIPNLVMENCSSGGHRLEPSMLELFSMASFSDAHECVSAPIIAANVHRAMQPAQSQIWAVLRKEADDKRLRYIMAGTFLGRMCLSGDIDSLSGDQWKIVEQSMEYYRLCVPVIKNGNSYRYGPEIQSYEHPTGYQILVRMTEQKAVMVIHTFAEPGVICEEIPRLRGFQVKSALGDQGLHILLDQSGKLTAENIEAFDGVVVMAEKPGC